MTGLTPDQIAFGTKAKMASLGPAPPPNPPGRWICHLCPWPRWRTGTYQQWLDHWHTHLEEAARDMGEA
jgi:hypothetical protein